MAQLHPNRVDNKDMAERHLSMADNKGEDKAEHALEPIKRAHLINASTIGTYVIHVGLTCHIGTQARPAPRTAGRTATRKNVTAGIT